MDLLFVGGVVGAWSAEDGARWQRPRDKIAIFCLKNLLSVRTGAQYSDFVVPLHLWTMVILIGWSHRCLLQPIVLLLLLALASQRSVLILIAAGNRLLNIVVGCLLQSTVYETLIK